MDDLQYQSKSAKVDTARRTRGDQSWSFGHALTRNDLVHRSGAEHQVFGLKIGARFQATEKLEEQEANTVDHAASLGDGNLRET